MYYYFSHLQCLSVLHAGCHLLAMCHCLWPCQILSMVFSPILIGRHCIFSDLLGACYISYAHSHPIFRVRAFYTCQYTDTRSNGGAASSEIIQDLAVLGVQSICDHKYLLISSMKSTILPIPSLVNWIGKCRICAQLIMLLRKCDIW